MYKIVDAFGSLRIMPIAYECYPFEIEVFYGNYEECETLVKDQY